MCRNCTLCNAGLAKFWFHLDLSGVKRLAKANSPYFPPLKINDSASLLCSITLYNFFTLSKVDGFPSVTYFPRMGNSILNRKFRYCYLNAAGALVALNVIVFAVTAFLYPPLKYLLSLIPGYVLYRHWYWQVFTYMFVHSDIWHLFCNMLGLYVFGTAVERAAGTKEFLLFYLLTGTLTGIASYLVYLAMGRNVVLLGASGALYAVMLFFSVLYPRSRIFVFGIVPVSAPLLVLIYFLISLLSSITGASGGIAHITHLSGLVFAFIYIILRLRINPFRAWGL